MLEKRLRELIAYDTSSRGVRRTDPIAAGLGVSALPEFVERLRPLMQKVLRTEEATLAKEMGELVRYRVIFLLLPEECLYGSPPEDKPVIRAHLQNLGIAPDEELVRAIKFICTNFRQKREDATRKTSISDVYVKTPHIYAEIMVRQNGRCCVCGVKLAYGQNLQLDHLLPFHLGDDPSDGSNWQFLCERCNRGKGIYPYYSLQLVFANWIRPDSNRSLREDVRYAALVRDGKCTLTGARPTEAELSVVKRFDSGCWVLDNVRTVVADSRS